MKKVRNVNSHLRIGEINTVLERVSEATSLLDLSENGLGAAKVSDFKASVKNLGVALAKKRSTKDYTAGLRLVDNINKSNLNDLYFLVEVNSRVSDPEIAEASSKVLACLADRKKFRKGSSEYRYTVLNVMLGAIKELGIDTIKKAGADCLYTSLVEGSEKFSSLLTSRSEFKASVIRREVRDAAENAIACFKDLRNWVNAKAEVEGSDGFVASFADIANEVLGEISVKVKAKESRTTISTEEVTA